jgi:NADH:ubiquinone oxidoreductase subunit 5 (subunit L)/multisubunit Na+/H+ antiporter MnhA subunit
MAESSYFLLVATFLPLLLSPVVYILGRRVVGVNTIAWFSFGVLAISTGLLFIPALMLHGGQSAYVESYAWSQFGNFGLRLDGLSLPFALIIYILCTVLALYSKPYMVHKIMEDIHQRVGDDSDDFSHSSGDHSDDINR